MRAVDDRLRRFARAAAPVLLTGESGTGKELAASLLHAQSARACGPFVAVNCGAIAEGLAEATLFGHERGAYTGADRPRAGLIAEADGGTLFLDEVGELSPANQARLLRVLEAGRVHALGAAQGRDVDVRVLAATCRDLRREVERGRFRLDLYYRLAVLDVALPPLRERGADLPELCGALLRRGGHRHRLAPEAAALLAEHRWPGNVRELRNALERAAALADGDVIEAADLELGGPIAPRAVAEAALDAALIAELDRQGGHRRRTYEALGMSRSAFYRRLRRAQAAAAAR